MKNKKISKSRRTGEKLAKMLTASLVLNPIFYMLPKEPNHVLAAPAVLSKTPYVKSPLPDLVAGIGKPLTLNLSNYIDGADSFSSSVNSGGLSAGVNGSTLNLTNTQTGTFTVTVKGTASTGGTISDTFDVSVIPDSLDLNNDTKVDINEIAAYAGTHSVTQGIMNQTLQFIAPQSLTTPNTPPNPKNTTLRVNKGETLTIKPDILFDDADKMTIGTVSLTNGYATSTLTADNNISLTGLQQGTLGLNVSVEDGRGGQASNRFDLSVVSTVYGTNNPPMWNGTLTNQTVTQNTYSTINLQDAFSDLDGDTLQFNPVQVSQTGDYIQVYQNNNQLNIFGATPGPATITASVYDSHGAAAQGSFNIKVVNNPPVYVTGLQDLIVLPASAPVTINLAGTFTDNDSLTFNATSSNAMAAVLADLALISGKKAEAKSIVKYVLERHPHLEIALNKQRQMDC
jgi:hypothetical protein